MNLNLLDPKLIALVAAVTVIVAVLAWLYVRKRRSTTEELRKKFGPEYDRAVLKHGSERKAEAKLADREKRVEKLNRKSTRLNSSHLGISYAVFCLKKKNKQN